MDLMTGERHRVEDREIALAYVRNAELCQLLTPATLEQTYPQVLDAATSLGEPAPTAVSRIAVLLRRHGSAVTDVMQRMMDTSNPASHPANCLPRIYGEMKLAQVLGPPVKPEPSQSPPPRMRLEFDASRKRLTIDGSVEIRVGATFSLLSALSKVHLEAAGKGLDPLEYPATKATALARLLSLDSDEGVRQAVNRARNDLAKKFTSAGLDPERGKGLVENLPWQGYRLAPDIVEVRMIAPIR